MIPAVPLSPPLFAILARLVEDRTGICYEERDKEVFSGKVHSRANEAGFESPLDYYYYLRYDDPGGREFDALVERLVVNETYFFREAQPLRVACDDVLAPAVAAQRRPRVWCAACSTGEEPLTLAMLLAERDLLGCVEIVASDISARALAVAAEATYGPRSLRSCPESARTRWMQPSGDRVAVRREISSCVAWRKVNLLDDGQVASLGTFDVILCRNVLIYFSDGTVSRVVANLGAALRKGGRLVVGASESLLRFGTMLACEERGGTFFYTRVAA